MAGLLLQAAHMPMYKTKLCQKFMQTGQCNRGDECSFAHGYQELRQPPPGAPRGPGGPAQDMPGMGPGPGPGPGPMGINPVSFPHTPGSPLPWIVKVARVVILDISGPKVH